MLFSTGAVADEIPADSRISNVTVYRDRALITREAVLNVKPGLHKIIVKDLSGGLQDDSIRGWGEGTAKMKLNGLNISRKELDKPADETISKIEAKIEEINIELAAVNQEKNIISVEKIYLESFAKSFIDVFDRGILTGESGAAKLTEAETYVALRLKDIANRTTELAKKARELERERKKQQEELDKLTHPGQSETKTLTVDVECVSAGNFKLQFSYIMYNAGWAPIYDVRAGAADGKIKIVSKGKVVQKTGEDWTGIELTLSSVSPQIGGDMPEPTPIILDLQQQYEGGKQKSGLFAAREEKVAESADMGPQPPPPPMQAGEMTATTAQVISGETAVEFKVVRLRTISSDGKPNIVPIDEASFEGKLNHIAVPVESPFAYMQSKVKNTSGRSYLKGEANIFLADKFIGKASIPQWEPEEKIDIPLGIDEGVSVERKLINRKQDTSFGKTTIDYEYKIKIVNNRSSETSLKLYEPIPQTRNSDIDVAQNVIEPKPTEIEQGGKARWDLTIASGATINVTVSYRVKYPSGRQIENLP